MKVLVACEESQEVCKAFRAKGHEAYSCDIISCSGGHPEWHIRGDVLKVLRGGQFRTMDGMGHYVSDWDMVIAFPPCTYMTTAGACRMYHKQEGGLSVLDEERVKQMIISRDLFMSIFYSSCEKVCIENPTPMKLACLPEPSQIIQPYQFGHPFKKNMLVVEGIGKIESNRNSRSHKRKLGKRMRFCI